MARKRDVLDYRNDCVLFETTHFMALTNAFQGRAHIMIRTHRDAEDTNNNLNNFPLEVKREFWHLCQKVVADSRIPSLLCHHFGEWRSAGHFHVHIVTRKADFTKYTESKVKDARRDAILAKLDSKERFLIKRHLNEFKAPEVAALKKDPPQRDEQNFCSGEWKDFRVELDPVYPWVKFIPKEPQVFSSDQREIQKQLETYREQAFSQMCEFAEHHKPGVAKPANDGCVISRHKIFQNF